MNGGKGAGNAKVDPSVIMENLLGAINLMYFAKIKAK
jgi:hypothetical protein